MLKPKKKLSKKEIKQDKFVKIALEAKSYVDENYKQVVGTTLAVFGVFVLIMIYVYVHNQNVEEATTLLGKAQLEFQAMNYDLSKTFLNELTSEYSGTDAADQGRFLLANIYFEEDNIPYAKKMYKEFVDSYSKSSILLASGYAGYAACLQREKNYDEAAANYVKAQKQSPEFVEAAGYLFLAGKAYESAGKIDKAREIFEKITIDYKDYDQADNAMAELIFLNKK
ncbi:MAG: tol-pal system YbgF family protein [Calditrichaceae bacterium]